MNNKVAIERCSAYEPEAVFQALKKAAEFSGVLDLTGKTVLLKPNILSDAVPENAKTTHPVFLEAAIRLVRDWGAVRILVGDSPGIQTPGFSGKVCGLGEVTVKNGAEWVDFTREKTEISCPEGKVMKKFSLTHAVQEADLVISLPKLKTHQLMYYTGAMKNLFGLIPSVEKCTYHVRFPGRNSFARMIVDLNLAVKPAYAFMDAIVGMEGPGPGSGDPRQIGVVMTSSNLLAMDVAACEIIGYPPAEIPVNKEALKRGAWLSDFGEIEYPGLAPADVHISDYEKVPFKKAKFQLLEFILPLRLRKFMDSFSEVPEINQTDCVRCGACKRICASRAIMTTGDGENMRFSIDHRKCIRCFCCHEVCPAKAIEIVKPGKINKKV